MAGFTGSTGGDDDPVVPAGLVDAIENGRCVAFVGAGFSAPAVPTWRDLLLELSSDLEPQEADHVRSLVDEGSSRGLESAAQIIRDSVSDEVVAERLRAIMGRIDRSKVADRVRILSEIPFRAILTTNFDPILSGSVPSPDVYLSVLRREPRWTEDRFWTHRGAEVVKLHGDLRWPSSVLLSARDYRSRLFGDPGYVTFLRSVLATNTVLFLGVSFTDAYVNQLRSEILELIGYSSGTDSVGYAVSADVSAVEADYLRRHEGIETLSYTSVGSDHSGFDRWLAAIHAATSPERRLGSLLASKTIVWSDPNEWGNHPGMVFLQQTARLSGSSFTLDYLTMVDETLERLAGGDVDLVITNWGYRPGGISRGERLMAAMRARDLRAPVVVFAAPGPFASENKRRALALGATEFCTSWPGLFAEIERIFGPAA